MKIAVTGGAGFIGSNFIHFMKKKHPDIEIICIDSLTYAGNADNIVSLNNGSRFNFFKADITDSAAIYYILDNEKPDAVVNFAAETHVDRSIGNSLVFLSTNIIGTHTLLEACLKTGVKRFHQISTDEVYGELPLDKPELKFSENSPLMPSSPYSASKASADMLVYSYYKTFGLNTTVSRCSNNYGDYQFPEKLIPLMISNALGGVPLPVYGDGKNIRDWIHVTDHCEAIDLILRCGKSGGVYNIGGGCELENIEVVKKIIALMGKSEELIEYIPDRKGHDLRYAVDYSKIEAELGWKPSISFEKGLSDTVDWYVNNFQWLERIKTGEYRSSVFSGKV